LATIAEGAVCVALGGRAIKELQPTTIHLHARHGGRRLIRGHGASCRDRQGFIGRGLRITLRHALLANPLRRPTHPLGGHHQFGKLFQSTRALRKTRPCVPAYTTFFKTVGL
jgi:hypothetical protein